MISQLNNIKIDTFFYLNEFECHCCNCVKLHLILLKKLSALRQAIQRPLIINSGYRCKLYNAKIDGVPTSYHLFGLAADVTVSSMKMEDLLKYAQNIRFGGIGIYDNFLHLDIRPVPEFWDQRT
ncbi:hypothetical protein ES705_47124 [subsurface metagenome]